MQVAEWDGSIAWADMGPDVVQVRISGPFGPRLLINFVITLSKAQRNFHVKKCSWLRLEISMVM